MYFASVKPCMCFYHSKKKKKSVLEYLLTAEVSLLTSFRNKLPRAAPLRQAADEVWAMRAYYGLLQSLAQTVGYQEETLIPSSNAKVLPDIVSSDGEMFGRASWRETFLLPISAIHSCSVLCLFWRGPPSSRLWYTPLQWDRLLNKPSRMHSQMDSIWPDWIGSRMHGLGVSVDVHLSFPLVV